MKSGLSGWVLAIARTLDSVGVPHSRIFSELGMDEERLKNGASRYSQEQVTSLWRAAIRETEDPHFGLKVATNIRPSSFHVVGYAMNCSATLGDALRRFARYAKLISNSATVDLDEEDEQARLRFHFETGGLPPCAQAMDTVLAGIVCFSGWLVGSQVRPLEVRFQHSCATTPEEYERVLNCPVLFDQTEDSVIFGARDLERDILSADENLASILDGMAISQLAELSGRFSRKVRESLLKQFVTGEVSKSRTASLMHMTERTLLRRLKDEGTTFQDVLDALRAELACEQLRRSDITIQEVSTMLGFSDASTFSRAFKRWTGQRPSSAHQSYLITEGNHEVAGARVALN